MVSPPPPLGLGDSISRSGFREAQIHFRVSAFTLIELMIVVGIMALLVATSAPPFVRAMRKEGIRKAVSDVVEGCSHARAQAILQGVPTEFTLRAEDGQITVRALGAVKGEDGIDTSEVASPLQAKPAAVEAFNGRLPDEIAVKLLYVNFKDQMENSEAHVRFFPNGTCDEFTVILSSATGEQEISLDVITGLPDVKVLK